MTDERYTWWKSEIAKARASGDNKKVNILQLDYNLELGECLAHQSARTKSINTNLGVMQTDIAGIGKSVDAMKTQMSGMETTILGDSSTVKRLSSTVSSLVALHRDSQMRQAGAKDLWRVTRMVIYGIATATGWAFAIYQACKGM